LKSPLAIAAFGLLALLAAPSPAQAEGGAELAILSPSDEAAIQRGLDRLVALQSKTTGAFGKRHKLASTSLAGLALLAAGEHVGRGHRGMAVKRAVDYILGDQVMRELRPGMVFFHDGEESGRTHAHGYAILFLSQVYGHTDRDPEILAAVRAAVATSIRAQTGLGGYGYRLRGESGFGRDEASVTVTQIAALRAARDMGVYVPPDVIEHAIGYVKRSMARDGSVMYSLTMENRNTTYELTAAAVSTLNASGVYDSEELQRGLKFMRASMAKAKSPAKAAKDFYFYGNLYACQALFQAGGSDWEAWFPPVRQELLDQQQPNHGWEDPRGDGEAYATATALLILQTPKRLIPIFTR
jgi:hypothetical protein